MNTFGKNVKISLFGEIYNKCIGLTIDGIPPGCPVNLNKLRKEIKAIYDKDKSLFKFNISNFTFITGINNHITTGAPITIILEPNSNDNNFKDGTIIPDLLDYSTYIKYYGTQKLDNNLFYNHQILKLLIIAGEIAKQLLNPYKINIGSRIYTIKNIKDEEIEYNNLTYSNFITMLDETLPMINKRAVIACNGEIKKAKSLNESLGGIIETFIFNVPITLGNPLFDGFESTLSKVLFSIPFIRGITFGDIIQDIKKYGSKTIDELEYHDNELIFNGNHQSGISNGITNGNLINFKTYIKSPSNIPKIIKSVNIITKQNIEISSTQNYNITYIPDAIYLVEALSYIVILDLIMENNKIKEV